MLFSPLMCTRTCHLPNRSTKPPTTRSTIWHTRFKALPRRPEILKKRRKTKTCLSTPIERALQVLFKGARILPVKAPLREPCYRNPFWTSLSCKRLLDNTHKSKVKCLGSSVQGPIREALKGYVSQEPLGQVIRLL